MFANIEGACPSEGVERLCMRCMYAKLVHMARKKSCFQKNSQTDSQGPLIIVSELRLSSAGYAMTATGVPWVALASYG